MNDTRIINPRRLIIGALLALLLILVLAGVAIWRQPQTLTLTVSGPMGERVLVDLVVDGQGQSHLDTAPVTYSLRARQVRFAIIPVDAAAGSVSVDLHSIRGSASTTALGVQGHFQALGWLADLSIGGMSSKHKATMRSAAQARMEASSGTH